MPLWNGILPLIGFIIFAAGIGSQIRKTYRRNSVQDIALMEVGLRTTASVLTFIGMWATKNPYLIIGNLLNLLMLTIYISLIITITRRRHHRT